VHESRSSERAAEDDAFDGLDDALDAATGAAADFGRLEVAGSALGELALATDLAQIGSAGCCATADLTKLDAEVGVARTASLLSRYDYACPLFAAAVFSPKGRGQPSA
jgi:hypothetical protein